MATIINNYETAAYGAISWDELGILILRPSFSLREAKVAEADAVCPCTDQEEIQ